MKFDEFVTEVQNKYPGYVGIDHIDLDIDEAMHIEGDGDVIYENNDYVVGKYVHALRLYKLGSDEPETVKFCVYGIGSKLYTDLDDYALSDYICFDFLLDW